jgi:hypothetical protein
MPYKFGEYVSTYVDPKSAEISEILRNRYMENFRANDQLAMAVDQMKAALPFENDMTKKAELEKQVNEKLEALASRGDYENLGFAVHAATKEFSRGYAPIKENYERYQGAIQTLNEQYKSGEIDSQDFNLAAPYMLRGYKGFEVDPNTGKVVEGSMYSAPTIYKNPKLMDRMTERLKGLHEDTYGEEVISSGMDSNGVWKSVSATKTSELTPDKILEVYNSVIQEPDVQMYLNQRADMMYYSAQESGNSAAYLDAKQKTNLSAIDAINNELNTKKYSAEDKKTLAGQIDSLIEENKRIDSAKADPTVAESLLKTMFQNDLLGPVKAFALSRRFEDIQTKRGYENNYHFILDAHRRRQDKIDQLSESISRQGDVTAADDISGSTTDEKKAFVADADKEIARLEAEMASPEFQTLSAALQNDKKNDLIQVKRRKEKTQAQIIEAGNKAITMADLEKEFPSFIGIFKEQMPEGSTPGEIYYQMKRTFDNPNDQDYKDFQNLYKQKTG